MEVCVDNLQSALNAEEGGACRIELCSSLAEGGLTPSVGFLKCVRRKLGIPIFVMIRYRGGDFVYTNDEIQIMVEDIRVLKDSGAEGFVLGVLNEKHQIDYHKNKILIDECYPLPVTFHRAFDEAVNPTESFQTIVNLGCTRLLTSGCQPTAVEGIALIKQLIDYDKIVVMPGSGISAENLETILRSTRAKEFHGSAKIDTRRRGQVLQVTDSALVQMMTQVYKRVVFCKECSSCHCRHQ